MHELNRLKIFTWHIHGSYLFYLSQGEYDIYIPVNELKSEGYVGRGETFPFGNNVIEVPVEQIPNLDLDVILFQTDENYLYDQFEILTEYQRSLPKIYLEHDPPWNHPTDALHPVTDPTVMLVHVTHFNALMWHSPGIQTTVIEHGVTAGEHPYKGTLERGIVVINNLPARGRLLGFDIFEELSKTIPLDLVGMGAESYASNISEGAVEELEKELTYTKQQLHTTIEQMETSLEELKSTNEELQSTNEELQSTNEEALTTKEEMQSLNEELMTINLQYQNKAEELTQLNNDMKNLLDNTEIGTIFLDNQLNILRFTPQVTRLFNVITSDIGRSITHIVSNFEYPSIEQTINEVITSLSGKELEIKTKKGEWYNLRIMPYRTMDNFINGAVLAFTKITPIKSMNARMLGLLQYAQSTADLHPQATVVLDADRKVLVCNEKFQNMFRIQEYEIRELSFTEIVINKWQMDLLSDKLSDSSPASEEIYVQHHFNGLGLKHLEIKIERIMEKGTGSTLIMILSFKEK